MTGLEKGNAAVVPGVALARAQHRRIQVAAVDEDRGGDAEDLLPPATTALIAGNVAVLHTVAVRAAQGGADASARSNATSGEPSNDH